MSKELEVINDLRNYLDFIKTERYSKTNLIRYFNDKFDIIETALKRLEELEEEKQSFDKAIEKKLKALEIIKEKRVDVCYFMNCKTLEEYNDDVLASYAYEEDDAEQRMLTQEEYDLLKEVLL